MIKLPSKRSSTWYSIWGISLLGNTLLLLWSRQLLGLEIALQNVFGFIILSALITLFLIPGYFGLRVFSLGVMIGNIAGVGYLLYLLATRSRFDGWIDLTSIFGFLTLVIIGLLAGLVAQIIVVILQRRR